MSEIKVSHQSTALVLNTETLGIEITAHGETWRSEKTYQPHFYVNDKNIFSSGWKTRTLFVEYRCRLWDQKCIFRFSSFGERGYFKFSDSHLD